MKPIKHMKIHYLFLTVFLFSASHPVAAQWQPAGDKIKTEWAYQVDPENVLPEYPRPVMERASWKNLNGLWEYAILLPEKANHQCSMEKYWYPFR